MQLVAKEIPQTAISVVKPFLPVNFKNVARPGYRDLNNVFDCAGTVGHDDDPVS